MDYLKIKSGKKLAYFTVLFWFFILSLSLSGITKTYCTNNQFGCEISYSVSRLVSNYFPADNIFDCCNNTAANRFTRTHYCINFNEELSFKRSKRFHVLQHSIVENYQKTVSVKSRDLKLEGAITGSGIPVITSSLLI